jgi:hypothetical protein
MAKILLDYIHPISVLTPTPAASTAFLKQACVVAKPKSGQEGNIGQVFECTSMTEVAARTDNTNAQQLFNAGMSKVFVLLSDTLNIEQAMSEHLNDFFTVLVSDDFDDDDIAEGEATAAVKASKKMQDITYEAVTPGEDGNDITIEYANDGTGGAETVSVTDSAIVVHMEEAVSTAQNIADAIGDSGPATALVTATIDDGDEADVQNAQSETNLEGGVDEIPAGGIMVGQFKGVVGIASFDQDFASEQAAIENRAAFFVKEANGAVSMFYAFGSVLANLTDWLNQQFISMPVNDDIDDLGEANSAFDDKVSFVLNDDEFGNRLALFAVGGKAIVAPYIVRNLIIDLQSRTLQWISGNQPQYTPKEAALLEVRLQEDVINLYIERGWISAGTVSIALEEDNFVASGSINIAEPKALWRVFSEMRQTL